MDGKQTVEFICKAMGVTPRFEIMGPMCQVVQEFRKSVHEEEIKLRKNPIDNIVEELFNQIRYLENKIKHRSSFLDTYSDNGHYNEVVVLNFLFNKPERNTLVCSKSLRESTDLGIVRHMLEVLTNNPKLTYRYKDSVMTTYVTIKSLNKVLNTDFLEELLKTLALKCNKIPQRTSYHNAEGITKL